MSLAALNLASRVDQEQELRARARGADRWQILLLPPNLVAHARLVLLLAAACAGSSPVALLLYSASIALDAADGWLARCLSQETAFGALYDVVIDNLTRALLWAGAAGGTGGTLVAACAGVCAALEGVTLACTHAVGGAAWKTGCFRGAPLWVQAVMRGGLRSPAGTLAVSGLFGLPLWLFARRCLPHGSLAAGGAWGLLLVPGRLLAAAVECWLVGRRVRQLLEEDAAARLQGTP